ncbi:hypothetical protein KBZ10_10860 [Streptomyces sp. F63]|uniref:hypothetical protein n=1 Tax=Streptomyces sp. F63 TaxID=2824887 RepID=UPI001B382449|nr:hypothetical protein [Streptomyces sp. F63]MBQ0985008.1 hypothetical protein [Streptomyces sp. F63]
MTACVLETTMDGAPSTAPERPPAPAPAEATPALTLAADGSYAARLLPGPEGGLLTERWTLSGPEPYAVRLPGARPEGPDSEVLPLADGRVLIRRRLDGRHALALLYPAGSVTGEQPVGSVGRERLRLLPPAPDGGTVYALAPGERSTELWRVHGGPGGPERVTEIPGHCSGGSWLDRGGQLLALDRTVDGRTKTVTVHVGRGGETSPLLRITEDSDDRLLFADPDSGLLLLRSNAPGQDRLGWGVLGSARPARFPGALLPAAAGRTGADTVGGTGGAGGPNSGESRTGSGGGEAEAAWPGPTPFAVQPGQVLLPEQCGVALRVDGPDGPRVGVWRPAEGRLRLLTAPEGWLPGTGLWTADGELRLPYATADVPCGLARVPLPATAPLLRPARVPRMAFRMIPRRDLRAAAARAAEARPGTRTAPPAAPPPAPPPAPPAGAEGAPAGDPAPPLGAAAGQHSGGSATAVRAVPVGLFRSATRPGTGPVPLREMPTACPGTSG